MFYLVRNSTVLLISAVFATLIAGFILYHIFHKEKKSFLFWLTICLNIVVVISTTSIFFMRPYIKSILFLVFVTSYFAFFISLLVLTIQNKRRGENDESSDDIGTVNGEFKNPSRKRLISLSIVLLIGFSQIAAGYLDIFPDIPSIVSGHYSTMKGDLGSWDNSNNIVIFFVNDSSDNFFMISAKDFNTAKKGTNCTVEYLPHSKYVVNILDQSGTSLLK